MRESSPRGIAVVDVGYTNTKIALFSAKGELLAERKGPSRHVPGPPYLHIDPEPMVELCRTALPELDRMLPIDVIVPTAHGAAMACLDEKGGLALPVMDYTSEPPPEIVAEYRKIMPSFAEAFCPLLPLAITHGLQLYWQMRSGRRISRRRGRCCRGSSMWASGCRALPHRDLLHVVPDASDGHAPGSPRRMARELGWDRLFPPMRKAWEEIGAAQGRVPRQGFRGEGAGAGRGSRLDRQFHALCVRRARPLHAGLDRHLEHQLRPVDARRACWTRSATPTPTRTCWAATCAAAASSAARSSRRWRGVRRRRRVISHAWQSWWRAGPMPFPPSRRRAGRCRARRQGLRQGPGAGERARAGLARRTLLRADGVGTARRHRVEGRHHRRRAVLAEPGAARRAGRTQAAAEGEGLGAARRHHGGRCGNRDDRRRAGFRRSG